MHNELWIFIQKLCKVQRYREKPDSDIASRITLLLGQEMCWDLGAAIKTGSPGETPGLGVEGAGEAQPLPWANLPGTLNFQEFLKMWTI